MYLFLQIHKHGTEVWSVDGAVCFQSVLYVIHKWDVTLPNFKGWELSRYQDF